MNVAVLPLRPRAALPRFALALQPVADLAAGAVWGHEALARGEDGAPAGDVLAQVAPEMQAAFDDRARARAVELAAGLGLGGHLCVNFEADAVEDPAAFLRPTLEAARRVGYPASRLVLEVADGERTADPRHLRRVVAACRRAGVGTAIDDFGAGPAGLNLLAECRPDVVKLDAALVRGIGADGARQAVVAAVVGLCRALGLAAVAEGVETEAELRTLRILGVTLMQGFLFARPSLGAVPAVTWPLARAA